MLLNLAVKCLKCGREAEQCLETKVGQKEVRYSFFHAEDDGNVTDCLLILNIEAKTQSVEPSDSSVACEQSLEPPIKLS